MDIVHIKSGTFSKNFSFGFFQRTNRKDKSDNSVKRFYWMRKLKTQVEILILLNIIYKPQVQPLNLLIMQVLGVIPKANMMICLHALANIINLFTKKESKSTRLSTSPTLGSGSQLKPEKKTKNYSFTF